MLCARLVASVLDQAIQHPPLGKKYLDFKVAVDIALAVEMAAH